MEDLLETIRVATAPDATADTRAAGAAACRALLIELDVRPNEATDVVLPQPAQIATLIRSLRGVPAEQLLDLAIAKARSLLPADVSVAPVAPLKLHIVELANPGAKP
jgi:hypothetical protein